MVRGDYELGFAAPRRRHDDAQRYVIFVLWLIGHSERTIAKALALRVKQVGGIIGRSEYRGRAEMTDQERRILLSKLADTRFVDGQPIDGGKLDKIAFEIRPLGESQLRGPLRRKMR